MKTYKFSLIRNFIVVFLISTLPVLAQVEYTLATDPELKVTGTSTIHDWEMESSSASGTAIFEMDNDKIKSVKNAKITMPAESLKSGKSGMDRNTYKALNTKKHKQIIFDLKEVQPKGSGYEAIGDFTIAGTTKTVKFPVNISQSNVMILVKGRYPFQLTDYNIDPPTALLGTVKTGNEVSIEFNVRFQPSK